MEIKVLIESGVLEMYCLGIASEEEKQLVETLSLQHKEIQNEIESINRALSLYASAHETSPSVKLKEKILHQVLNNNNNVDSNSFPPLITLKSSSEEWITYIQNNNIPTPSGFDTFHLHELPGNEKRYTYIAWAKKGAVLEESHSDEDEFLIMLGGRCSVTVNGKVTYYEKGGVVFIPKNTVHRAEALSDEMMILVGQRIAA